jgi:hypothetical protein
MSYTESGRLSALKETIRVCTVNDAINRLNCSRKDPYGNSTAAGYGNSESGRISALATSHMPSGNCYVGQDITDNTCCPGPTRLPRSVCPPALQGSEPATQTIQRQGSLIQKINANAIACGPSVLQPHISAGGIQESLRLQRLRDEIVANDFATNPNARYQTFVPPVCPPAANANNLPLTQPRFPCAPNVIGFTN